MATTVEASKATVEPPKPVVSEKKRSKPAAKEKKTKATKVTKPKSVKNASHPTYFEMIKEAILALKERGGSSPYAIAKYMEEKHKAVLPTNFRKILGLQLKNSATKGKLIKVKASYKLSDSDKAKAPKIAVVKKKVEKAKKVVAAKKPVKKTEAKKKTKAAAVVKKTKKRAAPPAKAKAKQPKSIKSPAKKAKKVAAA